MTVYTTMQFQDAAKYVLENDQPYINSIVVMSKRWLATLPPDLQKIVRDDGAQDLQGGDPVGQDFLRRPVRCLEDEGWRPEQAPGRRASGHAQEGQHHR